MTERQYRRSVLRKEVSLETDTTARQRKIALRRSGHKPTLHNQIMLIMGMFTHIK